MSLVTIGLFSFKGGFTSLQDLFNRNVKISLHRCSMTSHVNNPLYHPDDLPAE